MQKPLMLQDHSPISKDLLMDLPEYRNSKKRNRCSINEKFRKTVNVTMYKNFTPFLFAVLVY